MAQVTAQDSGHARSQGLDVRIGATAAVIGAAVFLASLSAGTDEPSWVRLLVATVICALLVCTVAVDLEQHRIPNRATGPAAIVLLLLLSAAAAADGGVNWLSGQ